MKIIHKSYKFRLEPTSEQMGYYPNILGLSCNEHHNRDFNASKNILKQGINILSGYGLESDVKQKQEEALPLGESMSPEA